MVQFMRDACAAPVDVLVMHGGTNDNGAGISVAQTEANLVQIWTTLMGPACGGKTVVYFSLLPRNYAQGAAAYFQLAALTRWARQWIAGEQALRPSGYGNIIFIDREPECTDQTSAAGNFTSDCSADGLHEGVWGPWKLSWKLAQALKPMLGNFGAYISTSQNDTYDATNNPTGALAMSPFYTMTGGTVNSPCTGSVPSGWQIARYAGSATGTICAGSTESTRSDLISGSRYQITQSLGSGTSSEYFELQPNNNFTPATLGVTLGTDAVFSQVWVEISNVANVTSITLNTTCENGGGATVQESQDAIWPANSGTLYGPSTSLQFPLITPPIVCPVGTSYIGENLAWTFNASGGAASATMTMKLANFTTRKYF
jgi:hypothetical protein